MNSILEEDIKNIADSKLVNWEEFNNKSILITGATGLICSIMIKAFCKKKLNLNAQRRRPLSGADFAPWSEAEPAKMAGGAAAVFLTEWVLRMIG